MSIDRAELENLLKRRFFYDQSFAIYGGVNGLYDYGPVGCALKNNLIALWRRHFVLEEQMLEIDCTMLTPEIVLKTSGHVDRFTDYMVKDLHTGECFRADHLIEGHLEKLLQAKETIEEQKTVIRQLLPLVNSMDAAGMRDVIERYKIKAPTTHNHLSEPMAFNLMFTTSIGPTSQSKSYLRPETAQGMFVNFPRLLRFNQGQLPFASAQIGTSFRNEISPRSGLLRVREFTMAEIEHFVDPLDKTHAKFADVADLSIPLYSAVAQIHGESPQLVRLDDAVRSKVINNETLGYFLGRIYLFLVRIGIDPARIRFRQHQSDEMAHYACDCWDAECLSTYGWIECVGCADRSCYDLTQHTKVSGQRLVAERVLSQPKRVEVMERKINRTAIGKLFRKDALAVIDQLETLSPDEARALDAKLDQSDELFSIDDKECAITRAMFALQTVEKTVQVEEYTPSVIEPTFGIGRLMYIILEHNFRVRSQDRDRKYFVLPPLLAPYKCTVLPLSGHDEFKPFVKQISALLTRAGIVHRVDTSNSNIGKRYVRSDEIAIPFAIAVDFDTAQQPHSIAFRELHTLKQIRVPIDEIVTVVNDLSSETTTWDEIADRYPQFTEQQRKRSDE